MGEYYLDKIAVYLRDNSRLSFTGHKRTVLRRRLQTRLAELDFNCFADYWCYLNGNPDEAGILFDLVTTNETSFFRNPAQFNFLKGEIIPRLAKKLTGETGRIRILCAGCSTGEEPYSVALTVLEALGYSQSRGVEIVAGDLSLSCLREAEAGFYETGRLKGLLQGHQDRYFQPSGEGAVVTNEVKKLIRFVHLNLGDLMSPDSQNAKKHPGSFDIIFCRNVMIYFSPTCQQLLIETLHELLLPGGYLFTGDAEPLHLFKHEFIPVEDADCLIYQKTESTQ